MLKDKERGRNESFVVLKFGCAELSWGENKILITTQLLMSLSDEFFTVFPHLN